MCDLRRFLPAGSSVSSLPRFESINLSLALQLVSLFLEDMTRGLPRSVGRGCNLRKAPSFEQRRRRGHAGWPALFLEHAAYHCNITGARLVLNPNVGGPNAMRKVL